MISAGVAAAITGGETEAAWINGTAGHVLDYDDVGRLRQGQPPLLRRAQ